MQAMIETYAQLKDKNKNLHKVLRRLIKEEADFRMEHREKKLCRKC